MAKLSEHEKMIRENLSKLIEALQKIDTSAIESISVDMERKRMPMELSGKQRFQSIRSIVIKDFIR